MTLVWRLLIVAATCLLFASEVRAHQFRYEAPLIGFDESPLNASPGFGSALVTLDEDLGTVKVEVAFAGLAGAITAASIHAVTAAPLSGTAIIAVPLPGFPTSASGQYDHTLNLANAASYDPSFINTYGGTGFDAVSNSMNALIFALDDGKAYLNIATTAFPNGEIQGFLVYLIGDFNNNGVVDAADYIIWRSSLGQRDDGLFADSNNDFVVDQLDYDAWRNNFGHSRSDLAEGVGRIAVVPEPRTISLILVCGFVSTIRRPQQPFC